MKTVTASKKVARWPRVSTIQALSSMVPVIAARKPVDRSCALSWPMPKAPIISGRATLTMVAVRIVAIVPIMTVAVTSQR